ncbi:hypothetical protein DLAC_10882 [Tieghemostelium lacteum]|uniref:F-box domain-containing protein n=1 Tax=Tieghemostelium lacteum TaxID=361077 RepID=A0A151Z2K5_TIELA|nr:hypothetical protein DLAC_10882 [Tieghemostelium lacteum]|eukprot:KYQ88196.1 hypothetical protein DLAC_10882 [Tieghemostelium lacteum]
MTENHITCLLESLVLVWNAFFETTPMMINNHHTTKIKEKATLIISIYKQYQQFGGHNKEIFSKSISSLFASKMYPQALLDGDLDNTKDFYLNVILSEIDKRKHNNVLSNLFLVLHPYSDMEVLALNQLKKLNLDLLVKIITDFSKGPNDCGYQLIVGNHSNQNLFDEIFEMFYSKTSTTTREKPKLPEHIHKFMEFCLFLNFAHPGNDSVSIVKKYYNNLDDLYQDESLFFKSGIDIRKLNLILRSKDYTKMCLSSNLFKQFYFSLPKIIIDHLEFTKITYQLQFEKINWLNQNNNNNNNNSNSNNNNNNNFPKLPTLIISKIIHFFYFDPTIDSLEKILISQVSKQWFQLCSDILSNYYDEDYQSNYIFVDNFSAIDINAPYCLFKKYPKHLRYYELKRMPWQLMEQLLYKHTESIEVVIDDDELFGIHLNNDTLLTRIEMNIQINTFNITNYISLFQRSPLLKKIEFYIYSDWSHLLCKLAFHSILSLQLPHLQEIGIYFGHSLKIESGIHFNHYHSIFKKLPKFKLISIPNYVSFSGFDSATIKVLDENISLTKLIDFYQHPLSTCGDEIKFSVKDINQIPDLINFVSQYHQTDTLSFCICQIPSTPISVEFVQSIFNQLNQGSSNIKVLSIYINLYIQTPKYSLLSQNDWELIDFGKYKYPNNLFIKFYQTFK